MTRRGSGWGARAAAWGDRMQARWAARARAAGPILWPEARIGGDPARGRRLLRGRLRIGTEIYEAPGAMLWDLVAEAPEAEAAEALHAMAWLDDLAALGTPPARALAQAWVAGWIERFGDGSGPGWTAELTGGRLLRLLGHGRFLLHGGALDEERLGRTVLGQARALRRRWPAAAAGRARIEALAALVAAALALPQGRNAVPRAVQALAEETERTLDAAGGIATRNPEELLEIAALLAEANAALMAADRPVDRDIGHALARAASVLRGLRHADGSLCRFHGGGRGAEGRLDQVLAAAGRRVAASRRGAGADRAMGFLRLAAGRTTVIVDAARPPAGAASLLGHASTLAFELTSGRRPVVVSLGPGQGFGPRWARAARATASHSTLALEEVSSARLGEPGPGGGPAPLADGPGRVIVEGGVPGPDGTRAELAHDGWRAGHGLTHARILTLAPDGRTLGGEDLLTTLTVADRAAFDRALDGAEGLGLPFALRFHLHPDVEAEPAADGRISLLLRSGEEWVFSPEEGEAELRIEPSVRLEPDALRPRPALQIVWAGRVLRPMTRLRWTLAKGYGTPEGLRDLGPGTGWDEEEDEG